MWLEFGSVLMSFNLWHWYVRPQLENPSTSFLSLAILVTHFEICGQIKDPQLTMDMSTFHIHGRATCFSTVSAHQTCDTMSLSPSWMFHPVWGCHTHDGLIVEVLLLDNSPTESPSVGLVRRLQM